MSTPLKSASSAPSAPPFGGATPPSLGAAVPSAPSASTAANESLAAGVLIVDEDASFRLGLQTFLKEFVGFKDIYSANNGLEALECLRENDDIEMVTLDQDMPEMDGLTFLRIVKDGDFPALAAVMITGDPDASIEEKFRSLNSEGLVTEHFLEKPVDFNDLESVLLSSHKALKNRGKDAAAKSTAAALAAFAAGTGIAGALAKDEKTSDSETESTNSQKDDGEDKTMNNLAEKPQADSGSQEAPKEVPTNQNPVLGVAPSKDDNVSDENRGGADWIGAGPPQTGVAESGSGGGSGAGNGELRARVDWLADSLNGRLDQIESQIANVSARTPSMAERFWLGLLKWITLGLLAWAFVRFDVGDQIVKYYGIAKAKVVEMTSAGKPMDLTLDPEEGVVKPSDTKVIPSGSDGGQETSDDASTPPPSGAKRKIVLPPVRSPEKEKVVPPPEKVESRPQTRLTPKPAPVAPVKADPSTPPAPVKSKPAEADKPKATPKPEPESKSVPSHPIGPKPKPKPKPKPEPEPKPEPKSSPSAAPKPSSSSESGDPSSNPRPTVGGKGDSENAKAKQPRQRKGLAPTEGTKPEEKLEKKAEPKPSPDAAGDPAAE